MCAYTIWQGPSMSTYSYCLGVFGSLENCSFRGVSVQIMWLTEVYFVSLLSLCSILMNRGTDLCTCFVFHQFCEINHTGYKKPKIWPLTSDSLGKLDRKWGLLVTLEWPLQGQFLRCETSPSGLHKNSIPARQNYKEMVLHYQFSDWSGSHSSFSSKRWHVI